MSGPVVKFKKLHEDAIIPSRKTDGSSGFDLYALEEASLINHFVTLVPTGIAIEIPQGYEAQVRCRSSMAVKGIMVVNGVGTIDSDYRGEIKVILTTIYEDYHINKGDRIAQLVIVPIATNVNVEVVTDLTETERGAGGFGSTGR